MRAQFERLEVPFRFFDAIDGRKLSPEELHELAPYGGSDYCGMLTVQEIGCAISHLAVLRQFASDQGDYLAVLEDDVTLESEFRGIADEQYLRSLPPFDVLQLDGAQPHKPRLTLELGRAGRHQLCAIPKCHHSMYGLIYTRRAARIITDCVSDVTAPIDNMLFKDGRVPGLRFVAVRPSVVRHADLPSVIGRRPRLRGLACKLERETRRLISWSRRWRNFAEAWGPRSILALRLRNPSTASRIGARAIENWPASRATELAARV